MAPCSKPLTAGLISFWVLPGKKSSKIRKSISGSSDKTTACMQSQITSGTSPLYSPYPVQQKFLKRKNMQEANNFQKVDIRVGKIVNVEDLPNPKHTTHKIT